MTRTPIPDFTETETWIVAQTLRERYGSEVDVQHGDSEIRLFPEDRELTVVPCLVWSQRNVNFVIFKAGEKRFRGQFYYRGFQQYGTGKPEYDDLGECVVTLLQVQADHDRTEKTEQKDPGPRAKDTDSNSDNLEYYWD
ncbi:MAG: hypothetical protein JSW09_09260 [Pseudomonadota bacterium]|nr:MAG: hypothetical protein JSW09_09260 [Pseudomonadota bacterium]